MSQDKMLKWALTYFNKEGWQVIPSREKRPLVSGFGKDGDLVINEEKVRDWWTNEYKGANISLLCGRRSATTVADTDTKEADKILQKLLPVDLSIPTAKTPRGRHRFFQYEGGLSNRRYADGLDIKTDGGLLVLPPSVNARGKYEWEVHIKDVKPPKMPAKLLEYLTELHKSHAKPTELLQTTLPTIDFTKGNRNESLFHLATCLQRGGMQSPNINKLLFYIGNHVCTPKLSAKEVEEIYNSAVLKKERPIASDVHDYVRTTQGYFSTTEVHAELRITTPKEKKAVVSTLLRMVEKGTIERSGKRNGVYRRVQTDLMVLDPLCATCEPLDIRMPFGEHNLVYVYPKNTMLLSGSRNAGKTCWAMTTTFLNQRNHRIWYMSSEMGVGELKVRLGKFKEVDWNIIPANSDKPGVTFVERGSDWHDIVKPNAINIIDYMELHDDFWRVGGYIRKIFDKLDQGIAIICLQKRAGDKHHFGRGGEFSLENPRFAMAMDKGKCQIVKAKNVKENIRDPEGRIMYFKITDGADIEPKGDWR